MLIYCCLGREHLLRRAYQLLARPPSNLPYRSLQPKVTDEANQMSELAGAKQKGEDKVRGTLCSQPHGACALQLSIVGYQRIDVVPQKLCMRIECSP